MAQTPVRCRVVTTPRADDLDSFLVREAEDAYFAKYKIDLNRPIEVQKPGIFGKLADKFTDFLRKYAD